MIEIIGALGMLAFLLSSLAIGTRLLVLARKTHEIPEIALGVGFVVGGVLGYAPETVILSTDLVNTEGGANVLLLTQVAIRIAALAVLCFTWRVFRPNSTWARGLAALLAGGLVVSWLMFPQTQALASKPGDQLWYDVFTVARSACIAWGAIESFIYYAALRRRGRLGLAPALVINRFFMWGLGLSAMTLLMATTLIAKAVGVDPAAYGWVLIESCVGLIGATTLWLTFFPNEAYRGYLARGSKK